MSEDVLDVVSSTTVSVDGWDDVYFEAVAPALTPMGEVAWDQAVTIQ